MHFLKDKALTVEVLDLKSKPWNLMKFFHVKLRNKKGDKDQLNEKAEEYEPKCYYLLKINSFHCNNSKFLLVLI